MLLVRQPVAGDEALEPPPRAGPGLPDREALAVLDPEPEAEAVGDAHEQDAGVEPLGQPPRDRHRRVDPVRVVDRADDRPVHRFGLDGMPPAEGRHAAGSQSSSRHIGQTGRVR